MIQDIMICNSILFFTISSPDVCILCMAAFCNLTVADCRRVCHVPCLVFIHQLMKTGTIHFPSFINASPTPSTPLFSRLALSIFCCSCGDDWKVSRVWLQRFSSKCHFSMNLELMAINGRQVYHWLLITLSLINNAAETISQIID